MWREVKFPGLGVWCPGAGLGRLEGEKGTACVSLDLACRRLSN